MAEIEPIQFAGFPYYDDYQDSKKFLKMLFKPGYALQARELTQVQTLLQKQISRFANHVFKDGSPVVDGQLGIVECQFIRVEKTITVNGQVIDIVPSQFVGKTIVNEVRPENIQYQLRMKVLHAEESEAVSDTDPDPYHVLFVEYIKPVIAVIDGEPTTVNTLAALSAVKDKLNLTTGELTNLSVVSVVDGTNTEVATGIRAQVKIGDPNVDKIATFGKASLVSNQEGIYYIDGSFILASPQTVALKRKARKQSDILGTLTDSDSVEIEWSVPPGDTPRELGYSGDGWTFVTGMANTLEGVRLFQYPSSRVGFTIKREVIDADADKTLLDPAYGSYNYAAPGSDRYKIDLILDYIPFTNKDTLEESEQYKTKNFVELTRVVDGNIRYSVKYPIYSDIEETLARRTYDESGSYTVKPFEIDIQEYFDDTKVCVFRETVREVVGSPTSSPFNVLNEVGSSIIPTGFLANMSVYGYRENSNGQVIKAWKAIVANSDTFLSRPGEVDFRSQISDLSPGYGTTLLYMIFGTPMEGDIIISEGTFKEGQVNTYFLKSRIPSVEDVKDVLYTVENGAVRKVLSPFDEPPIDYDKAFPHVDTYSDKRFVGKYDISRLYPNWSSEKDDPSAESVVIAINDAKSKLAVGIGTGKAYIYGYEFENQNTKYFPISKARAIEVTSGEEVNISIGNYVICNFPEGDDAEPITGASDIFLPSWSSLPKVELWNELSPNGISGNSEGSTLIGTARIRGVVPNEENLNVHLFDIQIEGGKYFADFDSIRYRYANFEDNSTTIGTVKLFSISTTGGPAGTGGTLKTIIDEIDSNGNPITVTYYDTILFSPKANLALFDLPSLCSVKSIIDFAKSKYDCKKTFRRQLENAETGGGPNYIANSSLKWRQYGSGNSIMWILCNKASGPGIVANVAQTSPKTHYTFKASSPLTNSTIPGGSAFQSALNSALGTNISFYQADNLENLLISNTQTNRMYVPTPIGQSYPIKAVTNDDKTILYVVYQPQDGEDVLNIVNDNFMLETLVSAQTSGDESIIDCRKKKASVIAEYSSRDFDWRKYFNEDGYFMIPLQNWSGIFAFNGDDGNDPWNVNFTPDGENGWKDWEGDDDSGDINTNSFNNPNLPSEYVTLLGFSDVVSVDEVLVWDNTEGQTLTNPAKKRDITKYFEFVSGTTDNIYDYGKLVIRRSALQQLKSKYSGIFKNRGNALDYTLFVKFKFLEHSGSGPFTVDSYEHDEHHPFFNRYEDIPLYTSPVYGYTFELRNCLDYRPSRENCTPARVASAIADSTNSVADEGNRPNALDIDCPIRDNSLIDPITHRPIVSGARGESETILPALGINSSRPATSYEYYTSRRDKIVLLKNRQFKIIEGKPAIRPESPKDVPESMSLYTLSIPQYTFGPEDVLVDYIDNKRFTMNDIAKLEKRIERVEYYTTLSLLEKEAAELSIPDPALGGFERMKNGIFVDNFKGHGVGDVFNPYYSCSMDFERGHLRPRFISRNVAFRPVIDEASDCQVSPDGLVTLKFDHGSDDKSPNRYIVQPIASRAISVNPFDVVSWLGTISLSPSSDTWVDTRTKPAVTINLEGENDAWLAMQNAFGTQWNDWETNWTGVRASTTETLSETTTNQFLDAPHTRRAPDGIMRQRRETTTTRRSLITETIDRNQTREGIRTTITPQRVTRELGDRVVDVSVVPFIRERKVTIVGKSLKPNTVLHAFFDNTLVDEYCLVKNGEEFVEVTPSTPIVTNNKGEVEIVFNLPGGRFKTGERQFRLTDSPTNDLSRSNTSGDASYFAQGMLQVKENTIVSTRVPIITRQTVTEERVVRDVVTRVQTDSSSSVTWVDPLAQTFLVDVAKNPKGVWIHSIDLFFKNKPTGESAPPVRVQIRPTVNGYPHSSIIIPFAECILDVDDVNISQGIGDDVPAIENENTYTRFKFSTPVYLMPGEYSIVVMSNSSEYECYIAEMGEIAIGSENSRITQQPYAGVFFKSQNASTWSADQNADLMFSINTCKFVRPSSAARIPFSSVGGKEGITALEEFEIDAMKVVSQVLKFDGTSITCGFEVPSDTGSSTQYEIPINENFAPRPTSWTLDDRNRLIFELTSDDTSLSPCIDSERVSAIVINNLIRPLEPAENNQAVEYAPRPPYEVDDETYPVSRYISRRVDLLSGLESDDLKVYLSANLPNFTYVSSAGGENTEIKTNLEVWAKVQTADSDIPFDDLNWMRMEINPLQANVVANDESTFVEYSFSIPEYYYPSPNAPRTGYSKAEQQFAVPFTRYAIKIVLYSNTGTVVPKVKDLRVIAVV